MLNCLLVFLAKLLHIIFLFYPTGFKLHSQLILQVQHTAPLIVPQYNLLDIRPVGYDPGLKNCVWAYQTTNWSFTRNDFWWWPWCLILSFVAMVYVSSDPLIILDLAWAWHHTPNQVGVGKIEIPPDQDMHTKSSSSHREDAATFRHRLLYIPIYHHQRSFQWNNK